MPFIPLLEREVQGPGAKARETAKLSFARRSEFGALTHPLGQRALRIIRQKLPRATLGLDAATEPRERIDLARVALLAKRKVDRIALSGVPVASFLGRKRMLDVLAEAQDRSGLPCDTDLEAHIAALKHLGASRIALATRWPATTTDRLTRYLAEAGIEVVANCSRASTLEQHKMADPAADHLLALELGAEAMRAAPNAQAVLMPGGLWHAVHAVPLLEAEFGRPVLLNIISTTWAALHAAGNRMQQRPEPRWSKLLASL